MATDLTVFPKVDGLLLTALFAKYGIFPAGNLYWVDSVNGSNDNPEGTFDAPYSTLQYAMGLTQAANHDTYICKPGHSEALSSAGAIALTDTGVSVVGMGSGAHRATLSFDTAVGADFDIGGANFTLANFLLSGGIDALTGPIDVNAADCRLLDIETRDTTGQATDFIVTDANADRLLIDGWVHRGAAAAGADTAITIVGGDDVSIQNFDLYGNFAVAAIENVTTAAVRLNIGASSKRPNTIWTENSADIAVTLVATATGFVDNIFIRLEDDAASTVTECLVGADMQFGRRLYVCNGDGERAVEWDGTESVG